MLGGRNSVAASLGRGAERPVGPRESERSDGTSRLVPPTIGGCDLDFFASLSLVRSSSFTLTTLRSRSRTGVRHIGQEVGLPIWFRRRECFSHSLIHLSWKRCLQCLIRTILSILP